MTVGTLEMATVAFSFQNGTADVYSTDGWEVAGSGVSRTAYRGPDGVIYKLDHGGWGQNDDERDNWETIQSLPTVEGVRVPMMEFYEIGETLVIAAEDCGDNGAYIPSTLETMAMRTWGVSDLHAGNVRKVGAEYVIIDIGIVRAYNRRGSDYVSNPSRCESCYERANRAECTHTAGRTCPAGWLTCGRTAWAEMSRLADSAKTQFIWFGNMFSQRVDTQFRCVCGCQNTVDRAPGIGTIAVAAARFKFSTFRGFNRG